jgi:chromosome partitioning protein
MVVIMSNTKILDALSTTIENASFMQQLEADSYEAPPPRTWAGKELAEAVGVSSPQTIYNAENKGKLPAHFKATRNAGGYTLNMVNLARDHFGTRPGRREGDPTVYLSFTNLKGGCWKSSTTHNVGSCAASHGNRVLLVDLDPQASLTTLVGYQPDIDFEGKHTLGQYLQDQLSVEEHEVRSLIKPTASPGMDIIPACLGLAAAEAYMVRQFADIAAQPDLPVSDKRAMQRDIFTRLRGVLALVEDDYDVIFMDGTPSLGVLAVSIGFCSDRIIVPCPTEKPDYASTVSFVNVLWDRFNDLLDFDIKYPEISILPTRFSITSSLASRAVLHKYIQPTFGSLVMRAVARKHDSAIGMTSIHSRTMFEVNYNVFGVKKDAQKKCMENFNEIWEEIQQDMVYPLWPSTGVPPLNFDAQEQ